MPIKPEFPPLLPDGFHWKTGTELHHLTVASFPRSITRQNLWESLEWLATELKSLGIKCTIWVDGSFVTEKLDPDDVDIVAEIDVGTLNNLTPTQEKFVQSLVNQAHRASPRKLHSFVIHSAPAGHTDYPSAQKARAYWLGAFGKSLANKTPKGIVLVGVTP